MTDLHALVWLYRFGMIDGEKHTLEETGAYLGGITRERVRQIEAQTIRELKEIAGPLIIAGEHERRRAYDRREREAAAT